MRSDANPPKATDSWLLGKLRRVTTSKSFIPEIDGLRFLAISAVVLLHLGTAIIDSVPASRWTASPDADWLRRLTLPGGTGVEVFFAISGFILALPFARQHLLGGKAVNLRAYYWRRLTRLEPPYFLIMIALFAVHVWLLHTGTFKQMLPHLGASLVYMHSIIYGTWSTINPVAWSLETEVQFYMLAPLFAFLFCIESKRARRGLIVVLALLSVAVTQFLRDELIQLHLDRTILVFAKFFLVGFLFADIYLTELREQGAPRRAWDLIGVLAIAGIFYLPHNGAFDLLFVSLVFVLLNSVFNGVAIRSAFRSPWITAIGGMCYTIYLMHYAFVRLVLLGTRRLTFVGPYWINYSIQAVICLPLVFLASAAFFLLVEKPCMYPDWPRRARQWLQDHFVRLDAVPSPE